MHEMLYLNKNPKNTNVRRNMQKQNWIYNSIQPLGGRKRVSDSTQGLCCFTEMPETKRAVKENASFHDCIINLPAKTHNRIEIVCV